jgi:hypothetical protein
MSSIHRTSVAVPLVHYVAGLYPDPLREAIEAAMPVLSLRATCLGAEVLLAEAMGLHFSQAVVHPDFPLMERVYFGLQALLQHRLPPEMRKAVNGMIQHGIQGGFDAVRELLFVVATNQDDPDAAMCRFLLWVSVRMNLLVASWDSPEVAASGALDAMEDRAEEVLRELLSVPNLLLQENVRPLSVLVAEILVEADKKVKERMATAMGQIGGELTQIMTNAEAVTRVRQLDDRHAVLFQPGPFEGQAGSTQIARRYPLQHPSPNALEQTRSRFSKKRDAATSSPLDDRFIDVLRTAQGAR